MSPLLLLLLSSGVIINFVSCSDPFIWPLPSTYTISPSLDLNIDNSFNITTTSTSLILQNAINRYMNEIIFIHRPDTNPTTSLVSSLLITTKSSDETLQFGIDESYELNVKIGESTLTSNTIYGALKGLETFSQLVLYNFTFGYYQTSTSMITDLPRFKWRGILIDTSRHYQSIKSIKKLLQSMTYAKLNVLHWHIVDTQSFPYTSKVYPKFEMGAFDQYQRFSLNDITDIVNYGKERGIRIVAEFDIPGHTMSWCKGYPEICPNPSCNSPNGESDSPDGILNPAINTTYDIIEGLFNEATNVFIDNYFHIGGDETQTKCWDQTPSIVSWEKENGFTDNDALLYFNKRALDIINNKLKIKKKPIQWDEMFTLFSNNISNTETTIQVWHGANLIGDVVNAGYQGIFSPNSLWYLDHLSTTWKQMYMTEPAQYITKKSNEKLLLGGEGCMWGETVDVSDIEQTIWPRMAAIAERLWSPQNVNNTINAEPRYSYFRCLLNQRGVAAAPYNNTQARQSPKGPGNCYLQR